MKYELPSTELIVIEENNYLKFGEYLNDMQCDDTTNKLCLDDLEYVKKLQQKNKILKENAENNDKVVDKVNWENQLLKKENQQLKNDINKLQKELNEENLQCSKSSIEFNNLKEKNTQLKDNWNKLKEYIVKEYYMYLPLEASTKSITILIDKMQELEGRDSNE